MRRGSRSRVWRYRLREWGACQGCIRRPGSIGLPESISHSGRVRNLGHQLEEFTTANLDFIQHYRPTQNVLKRPTQNSGQSIAITGHHEIMVPLIAAALKGLLEK